LPYPFKGGFNIDIVTIKDFLKLEPEVYLNDIIISFYLKFLEHYILTQEMKNTLHIFNTFFLEKLFGGKTASNKYGADVSKNN
jgi:Ulp1 family protease